MKQSILWLKGYAVKQMLLHVGVSEYLANSLSSAVGYLMQSVLKYVFWRPSLMSSWEDGIYCCSAQIYSENQCGWLILKSLIHYTNGWQFRL